MRWFTCTTQSFPGGPDFFSRDSGLLARGFQGLGIESRAVMPGPAQANDEPDLIRTDYVNLTRPEWWKSHNLDGVVLYSWGLPKYTAVAKAIRDAGIFLVLNQDSSGVLFPVVCLKGAILKQKTCYFIDDGKLKGALKLLIWIIYRITLGFIALEPGRVRHLSYGNVISSVSPPAVQRYKTYVSRLGRRDLQNKIQLVPHPVADYFTFPETIRKSLHITAVGRWDDESQKRPHHLAKTIAISLSQEADTEYHIIGKITPYLENWKQQLPTKDRERVHLVGYVPNHDLPSFYRKSVVLLCSSSHESFHIPAAESLCCGCSVVAPHLPALASFEWFCENGVGHLTEEDTPEGLAKALHLELKAWRNGQRNPSDIARLWSARLHASEVCKGLIKLSEDEQTSSPTFH